MLFLVLFLILSITFLAVRLLSEHMKKKWLIVGALCTSIPLMAGAAIIFSDFHQKMPYNAAPEIICGIADISEYPTQGTKESGNLTLYTNDGSKFVETYSELYVVPDGKNQIDIYTCDDGGFFWAGFTKKQMIVVHGELPGASAI